MKVIALLFLFALSACVFAQDNEVKFIIDPFTAQSETIVILIPTGGIGDGDNDLVQSNHIQSGSIMGGERGLELTVTGGNGNLVLSTGVSGGQYTAATPNEARGRSLYQLDGVDGTMALNPTGLVSDPNNNFLAADAFALRVLMESDLFSRVVFAIHSASGTCVRSVDLPGDDTLQEYILPYSSFSQGCDFSNVGAIEITIGMEDNVDVIIRDFSTWGPVQTCRCECPAFTCQLLIDPDDNNFSYYLTSQFGVFNPTTDLSTLYTSDTIVIPSIIPSFSTDITTIFSTVTIIDDDDDFFFSTSTNNDDDDDGDDDNADDDDDGDDDNADDDDDNNGSSSSSSASSIKIAAVAVIVAVFALL